MLLFYILIIIIYLYINYVIIIFILILSITSLFINDFLIIWFILEIINFLFLIIINFSINNKKIIFLYFIIQLSSSLFLIFSITLSLIPNFNNTTINLIILSLFLKLGIPPFHLWIPIISPHLSWLILFIILTIQKITPFYIINLLNNNRNIFTTTLLIITTILTSVIPPIIILKTTNFKILLAYSSINQSGWIILLTFLRSTLWILYFIFYSLILIIISYLINTYKINFIFNYKRNQLENLINILYIINLGGLPPFSFFFIKWKRMFISIWYSNIFIVFIIIIFSSLTILYIYINIILNSIFLYKSRNKLLILIHKNSSHYFNSWIIIIIFLSILIIFN